MLNVFALSDNRPKVHKIERSSLSLDLSDIQKKVPISDRTNYYYKF